MNTPALTVLMPVYNGAEYLNIAIESVLNQSYHAFEFLIINDGSTDNSLEIIHSYDDPRIKVITQENQGVSMALNNGLLIANGTYIARMDSDDICMPDRFEQQMDFLRKHPDHILVGSDATYVDKDGNFLFDYYNGAYTNDDIAARIQSACPVIHSSVIYLKSSVLACGGYDRNAYLFEDYFLWVKLINQGKLANIPMALMAIRFNPSSVTIDYKDYSRKYNHIKKRALITGILTNNDGAELKESVGKISKKIRQFSYHSLLAKKYLWNNFQPKLARNNISLGLKINPFKPGLYAMLALSFLPSAVIKFIYKKIKGAGGSIS